MIIKTSANVRLKLCLVVVELVLGVVLLDEVAELGVVVPVAERVAVVRVVIVVVAALLILQNISELLPLLGLAVQVPPPLRELVLSAKSIRKLKNEIIFCLRDPGNPFYPHLSNTLLAMYSTMATVRPSAAPPSAQLTSLLWPSMRCVSSGRGRRGCEASSCSGEPCGAVTDMLLGRVTSVTHDTGDGGRETEAGGGKVLCQAACPLYTRHSRCQHTFAKYHHSAQRRPWPRAF